MESSAKGGASRAFAKIAGISVMNIVFCDVLALDGVASEIECIDKDTVKLCLGFVFTALTNSSSSCSIR